MFRICDPRIVTFGKGLAAGAPACAYTITAVSKSTTAIQKQNEALRIKQFSLSTQLRPGAIDDTDPTIHPSISL
jgi:hypothetical protein